MPVQKGTAARRIKSRALFIAGVTAVGGLAPTEPARATDRFWGSLSGGVFSTGTNWQGGVAPGTGDTANFNLSSPAAYPVTLAAAATVQQMTIDYDRVGLDLAGFTFKTTSTGFTTPGLTVGQATGAVGSLDLRGGTLTATYVRLGDFGTGNLSLSNGGKIDSGDGMIALGFRGGSAGTASLSGADVNWTAGQHNVGYSGTGTFSIANGATVVDTDSAIIGTVVGSHGTATLSGLGSSWGGPNAYFYVGYSGQGSLVADDRSTMTVRSLQLGKEAAGKGQMTLSGATAAARSTVTVTHPFPAGTYIGVKGTGTLDVLNGALLNNTGEFSLGNEPGASGTLHVSGGAAGWNADVNTSGNLALGRSLIDNPGAGGGTGSITVGAGGQMSVGGRTYLGSNGGTGTLTLDGGTFTTHGLTALNNSPVVLHSGTLIIDGGSFDPVPANLEIAGATASDTATLRFVNSGASTNRSGSLYIGGSSVAAGPGAGVLDLLTGSSVTVAGPTKLWTGGTLNLSGGTLTTSSIIAAGGSFNFTAGGLNLTNSDLSVGAGGPLGSALTLTGASGDRNLISVSGVTTLNASGSLTINGGAFSTGKLVNNGAFSFGTGSLSLTNDSLTIGNGSLLGSNVNLTAGRSLSVSGPVTINPGASLTINGGSFSAPSLVNNGSFDFISGTLGGSADLIIDPGRILGNNVSLTAGRNLSASQGLIVGQSGVGTLGISGGGLASSSRGYIAQQPGSTGTVSLDGANSAWNLSSTLAVGGTDTVAGGTAILNVTNGAAVSAGGAVKVYPTAKVTVDSGYLGTGSLANAGTLELAHTATVAGSVTNTGTLRKTGAGVAALNEHLTNQATLQVQDGTLWVRTGAFGNGSMTVAAGSVLRFDGPLDLTYDTDLGGASSVTGLGTVDFPSGVHRFGGAFNVGNMSVTNAQVEVPTNTVIDHLTLNTTDIQGILGIYGGGKVSVNRVDFSGGAFSGGAGPFNIAGPMNITGGNHKRFFRTTVNLSGSTLWKDNGPVEADYGTVINNLASARFEVQSANAGPAADWGNPDSTFNNAGTYVKSAGDGRVRINSAFNNSGSVKLQAGSLQLNGGGMQTGSFVGDAGTTLVLGGSGSSTTTFSSAATLTTAGNLEFQGGQVNFGGHLNVSGTTLANQQTAFTAGADIQSLGTALFAGGGVAFNTGIAQTLPPTTLSGRLFGSDDLTMNQPLAWNAGNFSGTGRVKLNAGGTLATSAPKNLDGRILDNAGVLTWSDGTFNQRSTFNNLAGGTFDIRGSSGMEIDFSAGGPTPVFNNSGVVTKSAGNSTNISPMFINSGSVDVQTGMLIFGRGSSSTGSYSVSPGATLGFSFNTHTFSPASSISGGGDVLFTDSVSTFGGTYNVSGSTTVGSPTSSGSTTQVNFSPGATAANLGATTTINKYGTLALNTGQTVHLHDLAVWGDLTGSDSIVIDGNVIGRGTIQNSIVNDGDVSPGASPGTIKVNGNYKQDSGGKLHIELASPANWQTKYVQQYDQLNVTGNANLSGTLDLTRLDGYVPAVGDTATVMLWGSRTGTFSSIIGQDIGAGRRLSIAYGAGGLTVSAVAVPTEPWRITDANGDGKVTVGDLGILATHFGQVINGRANGDFNLDGVVTVGDLGMLATYFGQPSAGGASFAEALASFPNLSAVPEPMMGLLVLAAPLLAGRRRRE